MIQFTYQIGDIVLIEGIESTEFEIIERRYIEFGELDIDGNLIIIPIEEYVVYDKKTERELTVDGSDIKCVIRNEYIEGKDKYEMKLRDQAITKILKLHQIGTNEALERVEQIKKAVKSNDLETLRNLLDDIGT